MLFFNSSSDSTPNKKISSGNNQEKIKREVTVDDIRNEFIKKFGNDASVWTEDQRDFSKELNQLGNNAMETMTKEEIDQIKNIDALTKLSPEKIKELRKKLKSL